MKKTAIALTIGALLLGGSAAGAREKLSGEQRLAKILEGREAGPPVDCINLVSARQSQIIDKTAIVYDSGSVIYVNRPSHPQTLDSDDILVTRTSGSQLCRLDIVQTRDRSQFMFNGSVGLEKFVPYRRARATHN